MATYPTTSLQPGMTSDAVKQLQQYLISKGYSIPAGATGYYGDQTKAAVTQLQKDLGVDPGNYPGYYGPLTLGALSKSTQSSSNYIGPYSQEYYATQNQNLKLNTGNTPTGNAGSTTAVSTQVTGEIGTWYNTQTGAGISGSKPAGEGWVAADEKTGEPLTGSNTGAGTSNLADSGGSPGSYSGGGYPVDTGVTSGGNSGVNTGGNTGGTGYDTGDSTLNSILTQLGTILDNMAAAGKTVNPNIELTPSEITAFLDQAKTELNPYYTSYIDSIKKDLDEDLKVLKQNYDLEKEDRLATFKSNLANQRENEATRGTIFSGERLTRANAIKSESERSLESLGLSTTSTAQKAGTTAERDIGSLGLSGLSSPSIEKGSLSLLGEGQYVPIESRNLYDLQSGVYGTTTQARTTAEQTRAAELEKAEREKRALNFYNT
jgi:hypothetical protein